jgi:hypothetical protein
MTVTTTDRPESDGYTLTGKQLAELRQSFRGELIDREHAGYDVARRVGMAMSIDGLHWSCAVLVSPTCSVL